MKDAPFSLLVQKLQPERNASYSPFFQVLIDFQPANAFTINQKIPGLSVSFLDFSQMEGQFDLTFNIQEGEVLKGFLKYNKDLFASGTIKRMAEHIETLLKAIVDNPETSIHNLPMLTDKEYQQIKIWNDTRKDYPKDLTLVHLFEQQAEKTPDSIAVVFENQKLTYKQLNQRANQLASYLLNLKTDNEIALLSGKNPLIAISMERSCEMVIGLLAILKAGGAYVPIDPGYPKNRIHYMLKDSAAPVLLTQECLKEKLGGNELSHDCAVIYLEIDDFSNQSDKNFATISHAEDLAYMIYTSGSTGKPKGAMNAHSGIVNRLLWMQETYQLTDQDRILQKTPFSFDVSVWEFFWPLMTGACLVVAKPEGHKNPEYLADLIESQRITLMHFVPSMLQAFISHANINQCAGLKHIICSGEPLNVELVRKFYAVFSEQKVELHNLYGPTEAAVDVSHWPCKIEDIRASVPIGKPVANTQLYILDTNHMPLPIGIPGELCISGIQVGRGYYNRPKLTSEKFVDIELFGKTERIYKTGDLARWCIDGNIEFLGRRDHQVKLRGLRIELGEVEAALLQLPDVKECVVVVKGDTSDNKRIVAYVVMEKQENTEKNHSLLLKKYLKQNLPDYMLPETFIFIDALPLSPNGKIDRNALPESVIRKTSYLYPRDMIELKLSKLWEHLLQMSPISITDDFFENGGNSLRAIRLISNIYQEFNQRLPIHSIFQNRTIEQFACLLRQNKMSTAWSPLLCLQSEGKKTPLFFVHAAGGSAFDFVEIATLMGTKRSFYAIHPRGVEPGEMFHNSIEEMASDYVKEIQLVQSEGPYLLAGWSFGGTVIYEMARILEKAGESVSMIFMIDTPAPLVNLSKDDDVEFLMDRVPNYHGISLDGFDQGHSKEDQLAYLFNEIKISGLFTPDIDQKYAQNWLNLYKHHNHIIGSYDPSGTVNGKIIFIKPSEKTPFDDQMGQPSTAWKKYANGGYEICMAPGNHFNMVSPANSPALVKILKQYLERIDETKW
jgi:amino acid adenylation domain-containing protein